MHQSSGVLVKGSEFGFGNFGVVSFELGIFGVLEFLNVGCLEFWFFCIWDFWRFGVVGCWGSCLDFIIQRSAKLRVQVCWL